jgi:LmbE family N-acetylglucosaminyl deacetylase
VSTIVFLHAHPDDEASQTSGTMARAAAEGHRVVVVFATGGEHGELPAGGLPEGEALVDWRRREAQASADVLGLHRVEWLGYVDSGMTGWEQNSADGAFHGADLDESATRLATLLDEERADVLVGYDWHGGYGHPDHGKAHHVAHRAADLAATRPRLLEATFNRDLLRGLFTAGMAEAGEDILAAGGGESWDPDAPQNDGNPLGTPEADIHWQVDVSGYLPQRRAALEAHRSQATDIEAFLAMPDPVFEVVFGLEHYREPGLEPRMRRGWPFAARA